MQGSSTRPAKTRGRTSTSAIFIASALLLATPLAAAQPGQGGQFGPGAPGGGAPGGQFGQTAPGGGGFGNSDRLEILERFDLDSSGFLDASEREAAKEYLQSSNFGTGGGGPRGGGFATSGSTGVAISPDEVETYAGTSLYDTSVLRTIFIEFDTDDVGDDWEAEMAAFFNTDVELPVTATIDGVVYEDVGVRFRGNSSYSMVPAGLKRPIRIKLDSVVSGQSVEGVRTIKLLNGINDPSFLRTVLVSTIMQDYIAAPRASFVRLVVNGENWGIYQNQQHYNTDFLRDHYGESGGVRWEISGSPNGQGGWVYLGEDPESYRDIYEIQNRDTDASWAALIELFRVIDQTPTEELVAALEPILDIEETLAFLALDVVIANSDGFWTRASDYELYLAEDGRFHIIPHDLNEALGASGGGGGGGGGFGGRVQAGGFPGGAGAPGAGGASASTSLDPLVGLTDTTKPLRSKLLAVPELKKRYLEIVLDIAERWLDWDVLGPLATEPQTLISDDVQIDTRKLYSFEQFLSAVDGGTGSLRSFVEQRRENLLSTVPTLIAAIGVDSYLQPEPVEMAAVSTDSLQVTSFTSYVEQSGPEGWFLTSGSGQVVALEDSAAFVFDTLTEGFGDNKLDQCVLIDASQDLAISLQVYAQASNASGLAVRVNPNFHATLASCEAAMAANAGGDRLSGGRNNDDLDLVLTQADGGQWLTFSETELPELRFAAADIPEGAQYLRLSVRARDRSGVEPAQPLYLANVSVLQGDELVVNGDFSIR